MDRFTALEIDKPSHPMMTTLFTYEDKFIDEGLRLYDLKQALHLYLKGRGYKTIVFYNTATGFSSYEKEMLSTFLKSVEAEGDDSAARNDVTLNVEQTGRRSGSRLGQRLKKKIAGASLTPESEVSVTSPERNLWYDERNQRWHRTTIGDRIANMDQIVYNLPLRRHLAIIVDASDQEAEFTTGVDMLTQIISETEQRATIDKSNINDNRFIVLVNAQSCRLQLMRLFFGENNYEVQHPSVFMNGFFRSKLITLMEECNHYTLDTHNAFSIGQPTKTDVKRALLLARMDSDVNKNVEWSGLDDICEQLSLQDKWTFDDLYESLVAKAEYTYPCFISDNVKKRGNAELELNSMIGLANVKRQIAQMKNLLQMQIERGDDMSDKSKHMVFYGNPGTGKTTVARICARIFKDLGLVSKGHLVEVNREDLVAGFVGQTAIKTQRVIDSALDGVLFVDEAYRLAEGGENDFGREAVETLMARMENDRGRLVVILAGYKDNMRALYKINPGLDSRLKTKIDFEDYTSDELKQIFLLLASKRYTITPEVDALLDRVTRYAIGYKSRSNDLNYAFPNGRFVRNLFESVEVNVANRPADTDRSVLIPADFENIPLDEMRGFSIDKEETSETEQKSNLELLMEMTGLEGMKEEVQNLISDARYVKQCEEAGIEVEDDSKISMHMVFSGNPGTGKTTVARLMGRIYYDLGLLSSGHVVEIQNRGMLVCGYQGQTAINVNEIVDRAKGGVLFVDEIYSLVDGEHDSFGKEALNTLLSRIENDRDEMVVILAGYEELMGDFFSHNPGMQSRFNKYIHFADYSAEDLTTIVGKFLAGSKNAYTISEDAQGAISEYVGMSMSSMTRKSGNARWARNFADWIKIAHRSIMVANGNNSSEALLTYTKEDVIKGKELFKKNQLKHE